MVQWLRIRLAIQGTSVRSLVWEDPTCCGAARPLYHKSWNLCAQSSCFTARAPLPWEAGTPRAAPARHSQPKPEGGGGGRHGAPPHHTQSWGEESCCTRCLVTVPSAWSNKLSSSSLSTVVCFLPPLHSQLFEIREAWLLSGFLGVRNVGNVQIIPYLFFFLATCRTLVPSQRIQELNSGLLQWKLWILATGLSGNSQIIPFLDSSVWFRIVLIMIQFIIYLSNSYCKEWCFHFHSLFIFPVFLFLCVCTHISTQNRKDRSKKVICF